MKRLVISFILLIFFVGGRDIFAQATVEGKLILPEPAPGREYWVLVDHDVNGFVRYRDGICGSDTVVSYTINNVPAGTYYIYAGVRIVSYSGSPPEVGDYLGIYGGTIDEYPNEPNSVVPASGTVTFDVIMSKWTWDEMFVSHIISQQFDGASSVFATDIDSDGDMDILSAANIDGIIGWYENLGENNYKGRILAGNLFGASAVYAADIDGDGDMDVIGAAENADIILWWENTIGEEPTSVELISASMPKTYELEQNYPNPFNARTFISYHLPLVSDVELSIYNIFGQKVTRIVSEKKSAGYYKVEWDASGFASGVYFYRLATSTGFVQTKKLLLLK